MKEIHLNDLTSKQLNYTLQTLLYNRYNPHSHLIWEIPSNFLSWIKEYVMDIKYIILIERFNDDLTQGNWIAGFTIIDEKSLMPYYYTAISPSPELSVAKCLVKGLLGETIKLPVNI